MKYIVFPTIDLQEVPHKMIKTIADDGSEELSFPYPTYEGEELNTLLSGPDWSSSESII